MSSMIAVEGDDQIRRVTLTRPDVRNAFNAELIEELTGTLHELAESHSLRALVLAAEGSMFCAGADFHWMRGQKDASYEENAEDARRLFDMFAALYHFPRPTIARVQGGAFGGGVGLVACCDVVVMAEDALLSFSEVRMGLVPATISPFVIRKIGEGRAREAFLTGASLTAARSHELGLVNRVVPINALDSAVQEYIDAFRRCGPEALRVTKKLLRDVPGRPLSEAREFTAGLIAAQRVSAEGQEGMAAFLEKRKPEWVGSDV